MTRPKIYDIRHAFSMAENDILADSLAEQVFRFLQEEIVEGRLKPRERIREKELSLRLGVSRTPIREALLKLEMAGVIVCNARKSYNVRALVVADVKEAFEILGVLEGAVAGCAVQRITESDLDLLREYNQNMAEAGRRGDFHNYGAWNEKFHDVFISKYPNRSLREMCNTVRRLLYVFPVRKDSLPRWIAKCVQEHEEIIRLAAAKDGPALAAFLRDEHWNHHVHSRYIEDVFAEEELSVSRPEVLEGRPGFRKRSSTTTMEETAVEGSPQH